MGTFRILYVDDDADIREIAVMSLGLQTDFEVRPCASGRLALQEAAAWRPHLVLLDVMMPEMDGPETLNELKKMPEARDTPVVFITARTHTSDVARFMAMGAAGVIAKPFDPLGLGTEARSYLTRTAG